VAIDMGYGHLRPAHALADAIGGEVLEIDRPPIASPAEEERWAKVRRFYVGLSRLTQSLRGAAALLDEITAIPPLYPRRDLSAPTLGARGLDWLARRGVGEGLARYLEAEGRALLTTFYAPAVTTDVLSSRPVYCVVTDSDINRVWVPLDPAKSRVRYLAPSHRVVRRLEAYGVRPDRITLTGFPLPGELVGGRERRALHANLAARLARLDPGRVFTGAAHEERLGPLPEAERGRPPLLTFAVGGAGAQSELAIAALPSLRGPIAGGKLRLALVAGVRREVAARFRDALDLAGIREASVLVERDIPSYLRAFNALLAETDILWSKPSEIAFFAALGLPLVIAPPVGVHEGYNRRFVVEAGAGIVQNDPRHAGDWLCDWIADGTLAAAAWSGATRLPNLGLYEILDVLRAEL
jgi:UDP-N-acetylglucosamine:LPS N-acetylglucosamine transferase